MNEMAKASAAAQAAAKLRIDVEALVYWALVDQMAAEVSNAWAFREVRWLEARATPSGRFDDWATLGGLHVDGGAGPAPHHVHPDAAAVDEALGRVDGGALLRRYARLAQRPDWKPGARFRYQPKRRYDGTKRDGEIVVESGMIFEPDYDGRSVFYKGGRNKRQPCSLIEAVDHPAIVVAARDVYLAWWGALDALRETLAGRLRDHEPVGPEAPAMPWGRAADARWRKMLAYIEARC